jgi:hypothetical protein
LDKLEGKLLFEDPSMDGRIILKCTLKKQDGIA